MYIGIDLGSTNIKAAIYDRSFKLIDRQSRPVEYIREDGFVEFDAALYCAQLAGLLDDGYRCVLIGLTPEQRKTLPENILGLPRTATVTELVQWYTTADLFLNPSTEETFGMTTLEALYCGTTPIVYEGTACEEIVREFGGIAVPRGAEHIHRAVCSQ